MTDEEKQVQAVPEGEVEVDEFAQVLEALKEHGKPILTGLAIAIAIYLGIVFYRTQQRSQAERAGAQLAAAATAENLQQIISRYGSTPSAPVAQLSLATSYLHSGQYALAQEAFTTFENTYPEHIMLPGAKLGVAYCLEAGGQFQEAIARFTTLEHDYKEHFIQPLAILGRARCLEQMGRYAEARAVYEDFIAGQPENRWVPQAETALLYVDKELRARQGN